MKPQPLLFALVGQTAVGKTALSLELARTLNAEIISADSRQIYRGMDIGTAKPTRAELATIPHHLIDVANPDTPFSLAIYQEMAMNTIADITARGRVPLLVGGTGQYLAAVLEGWSIPRVPPQPEYRAALEADAQTHGTESLHARLARVDPAAASEIMPQNLRRIIRALEVYEFTQQPISAQQQKHPIPYTITTWWLNLPTDLLYARIDARVDAMMAAGLLDEITRLLDDGYGWELPAMSSLGYIQFRPYVEGQATLAACVQRLKYDTHTFARRQKNWFRRLPGLVMVPWNDGKFALPPGEWTIPSSLNA